jgi:hypothetical protein
VLLYCEVGVVQCDLPNVDQAEVAGGEYLRQGQLGCSKCQGMAEV